MSFRIAGTVHAGSVLVFPDRVEPWPVAEAGAVTAQSLSAVTAGGIGGTGGAGVDILIVGCGPAFQPPPDGLGDALRRHGLVLEWMDTGAACRTFNVLLVEERVCAAALIAVA